MSHSNVKLFNKWSATYDEGRMGDWFRARQLLVIKEMKLKPESYVLDVGCGTGWAVFQISPLVPLGIVCGLDLSPEMIEKAKQKLSSMNNIEFVVSNAERIPYPSQYFDFVYSTSSFHHYANPLFVLGEMKRVLKPNGELFILESCRKTSPAVWVWDRYLRIFEKGHVKYYTYKELISLLKKAHFEHAELIYLNSEFLRHGKIFSSTMIVKGIKKPQSSVY
jgi:ubiquinone/menaquinone biosynthesis C-methylase UbiE